MSDASDPVFDRDGRLSHSPRRPTSVRRRQPDVGSFSRPVTRQHLPDRCFDTIELSPFAPESDEGKSAEWLPESG